MSDLKPICFLGRLGRTGRPLLPSLTPLELRQLALRSETRLGLLEEVRSAASFQILGDPAVRLNFD